MNDYHFPVKLNLRIDWSELDYLGHVNNISIFKYVQSARVEYLNLVRLAVDHREVTTGPILASCKCDFKHPLFYPGQIMVQSSNTYIRNSSFGLFHQVIDGHGRICAEAHDVIVMYDFRKGKKLTIPQNIRSIIQEMEKSEDRYLINP